MDRHAGHLADQPVRNLRWNLARHELVLAALTPTHCDVVTGIDLLEQQADVRGIVLQIAVHRDQCRAARVLDAGGHRGGLAVVATEFHDAQIGILARKARRNAEGVIATAVIDEHDLVSPPERLYGFHDRSMQKRYVVLLVVQRNDHRKLRSFGAIGRACSYFRQRPVSACKHFTGHLTPPPFLQIFRPKTVCRRGLHTQSMRRPAVRNPHTSYVLSPRQSKRQVSLKASA